MELDMQMDTPVLDLKLTTGVHTLSIIYILQLSLLEISSLYPALVGTLIRIAISTRQIKVAAGAYLIYDIHKISE